MDYENDPGWKYLRMSRDEIAKVSVLPLSPYNYPFAGAIETVRSESRLLGARSQRGLCAWTDQGGEGRHGYRVREERRGLARVLFANKRHFVAGASEEGPHPGDEPAQVHQSRGYEQFVVSERRVGVVESA